MSVPASYYDSVFVNCPFDKDYTPLLHSILYTIYRCGFLPQCALGEDDGSDNRLGKIERCIENCRYGIHDISRIELNEEGLPRFNMPFELGIFFGAKRFGKTMHKRKTALVFEKTKYTYQKYISDLNGVDTKAHNNDPLLVIKNIRNWLATASQRKGLPGEIILKKEYEEFRLKLPEIVNTAGLNYEDIPFNDLYKIVEETVRKKLE